MLRKSIIAQLYLLRLDSSSLSGCYLVHGHTLLYNVANIVTATAASPTCYELYEIQPTSLPTHMGKAMY